MATLNQLRIAARDIINTTLPDEADNLARTLLCDYLDINLTQLLAHYTDTVDTRTEQDIIDMATRIARHEPLQYVVGKAHFGGRTFTVTPHTLIPRPETYELTQLIRRNTPPHAAPDILDIGTGSGCIAVTLKCEIPQAQLTALDISPEALDIARLNAQTHGAHINFRQCNILTQTITHTPFDIVVSNPPYICLKERADMQHNVVDYEPHGALFVPDDDPLLFYRRIARLCHEGRLLKRDGHLYFEINEAYGEETMQMMQTHAFTDITIHHDTYGKPRMIRGRLQS
jgi:release factor glutamine methyltransferase